MEIHRATYSQDSLEKEQSGRLLLSEISMIKLQ